MEENQPQQMQTPKPDKKEKKGCPLALIIILAALAIGGIGFGIFELLINNNQPECILETIDGNSNQQQNEQNLEEKDDSENNKETSKTENNQEEKTQQNNQTEENKGRQASYEDLAGEELFTNVLNYQHDTYYNKYHKVLTITNYSKYYEQEKNEHYDVECKTKQCLLTNRENTPPKTIILTGFSGEIKDFFYAKFGQAGGYEQLLFLMADGSVEYMPIYDAFEKNNIKSYGKIEGLKNIANFQQLTSSSYENNGELLLGRGQAVLAEDVDGNYYDLYYYLEEYM